jgi:hypothetical protein
MIFGTGEYIPILYTLRNQIIQLVREIWGPFGRAFPSASPLNFTEALPNP